MNSSLNETTSEADVLLNLINKLSALQYAYVYLLMPSSLIAIGVNILIFMVLRSKEFRSKTFFFFFKLNVINSIFLSLVVMTSFIALTNRVFEFTNSYAASVYSSYVYRPLLSTLYLNNSFLEIFIVIERSLYFMPSEYNKLKSVDFKKLGTTTFVLSFIISWPIFSIVGPGYQDFQIYANQTFRLYSWQMSDFSMTLAGKSITYTMYCLRDALPLITNLALNFFSVLLIRKYMNRLQKEKLAFAIKLSNPFTTLTQTANTDVRNNDRYISRTDRNQTFIAVIVSVLSFFKHVFYILSYIMLSMNEVDLFNIFYFLALVSLIVKHISNFFILYKYSFLFRTKFKKMFI